MKKLIVVLLGVFSMAIFAKTGIEVTCTHGHPDKWLLSGEELIFDLKLSNEGLVTAATTTHQGKIAELKVSKSARMLFEGPQDSSKICGTGGCVSIFGKTEYVLPAINLSQLKLNEELEIVMIGNDYMAWFEESLDCKRTL